MRLPPAKVLIAIAWIATLLAALSMQPTFEMWREVWVAVGLVVFVLITLTAIHRVVMWILSSDTRS